MYLELEKRRKNPANLNYNDIILTHRSYNDIVIIPLGKNSQALTKRQVAPISSLSRYFFAQS